MEKLHLPDQACATLRVGRYSLCTGTTYFQWIKPDPDNSSTHEIYPSGTSR